MNAEETRQHGAGAPGVCSSPSASLSTNATAFCIASLIGAAGHSAHVGHAGIDSANNGHNGDDGPATREQEASSSDSEEDGSESKITSEVSSIISFCSCID